MQFPDRAVLQATFASTEDVKDLAKVVRDCLADSCGEREVSKRLSCSFVVVVAVVVGSSR